MKTSIKETGNFKPSRRSMKRSEKNMIKLAKRGFNIQDLFNFIPSSFLAFITNDTENK